MLRVLRVCLTRETSLVKESVNLSGPLIQIVIDSIATDSSTNNDMLDATLDALSVLRLMLSSQAVSVVAVQDIMKNNTSLTRLLGDVQLSHPSHKVRGATALFARALANAATAATASNAHNVHNVALIFHVMFNHMFVSLDIHASMRSSGCATYFDVLEHLIPSTLAQVLVGTTATAEYY